MQPLNVMQPLLEFFLQNLAKPNMFLKLGPNFEATVFFQDCEAMLLMPEPNKTHIVDVRTKQKPCRYAKIKQY